MANNSYDKQYVDGQDLFEAELDAAFQSLNMDISNSSGLANGSTTGQFLKSSGSGNACSFSAVPDPLGPSSLRNYGLSATASSGALIVALKTAAAADPSGSDVVDLTFSSNAAPTSVMTSISVNSHRSITLNSSATLGLVGTSAVPVYVYAINVAGTARLALSASKSFDQGAAVTTVQVSASADSLGKLYASAALTVVPRLLGWVQAAKTSAGVWQSPAKVNITNTAGLLPYDISASTTTYSLTSNAYADVKQSGTSTVAITVTVSSNGGPIELRLLGDGSTNASGLSVTGTVATAQEGSVQFVRDGATVVNQFLIDSEYAGIRIPPGGVAALDYVPAGTYTYTLQAKLVTGTTFAINYLRMMARAL
jgi:hypothetical protein